ncbi:type II toxin-antitoxin system ParD family antitoxin [Novosphingobium sp.]|uniref:type II toxin-antitoxin system ParD family antitoxin n=1 Tax=Novosphingobium sp. TaxID=1874826 RepID=UPI003BAACD0A
MNVSLPEPMREFVQQRIESGQYASVSDYVRDLIRRDQGIVEDEARWLAELDASIAQGLAELDAGGGEDLHTVCAEIRAEIGLLGPKTVTQ